MGLPNVVEFRHLSYLCFFPILVYCARSDKTDITHCKIARMGWESRRGGGDSYLSYLPNPFERVDDRNSCFGFGPAAAARS